MLGLNIRTLAADSFNLLSGLYVGVVVYTIVRYSMNKPVWVPVSSRTTHLCLKFIWT